MLWNYNNMGHQVKCDSSNSNQNKRIMKIIKLCSIFMLLGTISCNNSPKKPDVGFHINGKLEGYEASFIYVRNKDSLIDSVKVRHGEFSFTGTLKKPTVLIFSDKNRGYDKTFYFYADNSDIQVEVDYSKDRIGNPDGFMKVTGSSAYDLSLAIEDVYKEANSKYRGAGSGALNEYKVGQLYHFLAGKEDHINAVSLDKVFWLISGMGSGMFPIENSERLLGLFTEQFADSEEYTKMREKIEATKRRQPGESFIDYVGTDEEGRQIPLTELYGKSYIFVDLWASWCGPCRAENPQYKEAMMLYRDKGFQIYSVSFDDEKERWIKAIREDKIYEFVHVSDLSYYDNPIAKTYKITGIPDNFLLDNKGQIIDNSLGGEDLLLTLEHLYSK